MMRMMRTMRMVRVEGRREEPLSDIMLALG